MDIAGKYWLFLFQKQQNWERNVKCTFCPIVFKTGLTLKPQLVKKIKGKYFHQHLLTLEKYSIHISEPSLLFYFVMLSNFPKGHCGNRLSFLMLSPSAIWYLHTHSSASFPPVYQFQVVFVKVRILQRFVLNVFACSLLYFMLPSFFSVLPSKSPFNLWQLSFAFLFSV